MDLKKKMATIVAAYPERVEVYETSDGLIHLEKSEAEAQAKHLPVPSIKTHKLPKKR